MNLFLVPTVRSSLLFLLLLLLNCIGEILLSEQLFGVDDYLLRNQNLFKIESFYGKVFYWIKNKFKN